VLLAGRGEGLPGEAGEGPDDGLLGGECVHSASGKAIRWVPGTASKCGSLLRTGSPCWRARAAIQVALAGIGVSLATLWLNALKLLIHRLLNAARFGPVGGCLAKSAGQLHPRGHRVRATAGAQLLLDRVGEQLFTTDALRLREALGLLER